MPFNSVLLFLTTIKLLIIFRTSFNLQVLNDAEQIFRFETSFRFLPFCSDVTEMTGSDLVRYDRQLSLSPITLGLTSVFGPVGMVYAQNGTAFASDVIARLLWMILERLLRSIHSAASQYLQQWKQLKEEGIRERLESAFKGKSHADDMPSKPSVTEAVHGASSF